MKQIIKDMSYATKFTLGAASTFGVLFGALYLFNPGAFTQAEPVEPVFKVAEPIEPAPSVEIKTLPDSDYTPPPEKTEAELFQVQAQASAGGLIASEAISLMDTDGLYYNIRPAICDMTSSFTVADTQDIVEDQMRKQGHDEVAAEKIARGLVDATMDYGCN